MFPKFHGITLALNSWIANAVVENLATDPAPLGAGRIWFNTTDKGLKFSSLDAGGAVVVQVVASGADVQAALDAISALGTRVTAIEGAYVPKDGSVAFTGNIDAGSNKLVNVSNGTDANDAINKGQLDAAIGSLANAFKYIGTVAGGADAGSAFDMTTTSSQAVGSYYKVATAGYFKVGAEGTPFLANLNDGLVFNTAAGVDIVDNTNSTVAGTTGEITVSGSTDTGYTVALDAAFKSRVSTLESGLADEISRAEAAEGDLTALTTSVKTSLVAAINSEVSRATTAEGVNAAAISAETTRATAAEGTNATAISNEVTRATGVEGSLSSLTTTAKTDLVSAINEVAASGATTASGLAAEITRATAAEGTNASAISAETTRAEAAEGDLSTLTTTAKSSLVAAVNEVSAASASVASDLASEVTRATAAEGTNASAISAEVTRATGAEGALAADIGTLGDLTTTAKSDLVSAINEVAAAAGTGTGALKSQINGQRYVYTAATAALTHTVTHGLGSAYVAFQVLVKGDDGLFRNDIVAVEETSGNVLTVTLTESRIIKLVAQALDALA
jgi:hypothetical protein